MAKMYAVTQQTWSGWENGMYAPPPHIMKQIENDIGRPMEEIFFDVFHRNN